MTSCEHYSLQQNLGQAQAVMAQLMVLTGKEATTSGKISDTQIAIAEKFQTSTDDVVDASKKLFDFNMAVAGISLLSSTLSSVAGGRGMAGLGQGLQIGFKAVTYVAAPVVQGSLQFVEAKAQRDLGDVQKTQAEYGSSSKDMSGQTQTVIDSETQSAQKAAAISRDLSQIVSDEKQASM